MSYSSESVNTMAEGTSSASAVQRSNAGFKSPGQTAFAYTGKINPTAIASGASTSVFVLATLTTLNSTTGLVANAYITDFQASSDFANASGNLDVRVQLGGVDMLRTSIHNLAPADFVNMETQPNAVAGNKQLSLVLASAATTVNVWFFLSGWTE